MTNAQILFQNNAASVLASGISAVSTTAVLSPGTGVLFPIPGGNQFFVGTFISQANATLREIVQVTSLTGDTIAVMARAQEGTIAQAWVAGDFFQVSITAGGLAAVQSAAFATAVPLAGGTMSGPLRLSVGDNYVSGGTTQGTATLINTQTAIITNALTGALRLPTVGELGGLSPGPVFVSNQDPTNTATLWPSTGGNFNFYPGTTYVTIAPGVSATYYPGSTLGQWWFS